jgi:hypothetical protein
MLVFITVTPKETVQGAGARVTTPEAGTILSMLISCDTFKIFKMRVVN